MKVSSKLFVIGFIPFLVGCSSQKPGPIETKDKLTFVITKNECHVRATSKDISGEINIPSTYKGLSVTLILANAFYNCKDITSVSIPKTITNIDTNAFYGCSSLSNVNFASDSALLTLGYRSFARSGVSAISLPNSVTSLKDNVFEDCSSLRNINISTESNLSSIGDYSFKNCEKLESLYFPKTLSLFNSNVFEGCSSLSSIEVDPSNQVFSTQDGIVYDASKTKILIAPKQLSGSIVLPETLSELSTGVFSNCSKITSLVFSESIKTIPDRAFQNCESLCNVTFLDDVTRIGDEAFASCFNLLGVDVGESFTYIGHDAFRDCSSLEEFHIPSATETIGANAFQNCKKLADFSIAEDCSIESFDDYTFAGCSSLTSFTIPSSVIGISSTAFVDMDSLEEFVVLKGNRNLSSVNGVLIGAKGTTILKYPQAKKDAKYYVPMGVKSIKQEAFRGNPYLTEISFLGEPSLASFPNYVFQNCVSLETVNIPKSLTVISATAFDGCIALKEFFVSTANRIYSSYDGVLYNKARNIIMMMPMAKSDSLKIAKEVVTLDEFAVVACHKLTSISFQEDTLLKNLESYSISECNTLREIHLPISLENIKSKAIDTLPNIEDIYYEGTTSEFASVKKASDWLNVSIDVIHCSNGDYNL